ncbi:hypothetical protein K788_0005228 [Paraburkholderia caribensis MBA4]|uniref:Uncharacterized protein n=1 Tax=Paraburkholderia caribensis MBA4 TaxID=1323664 RepID=A0A0P0RFI8_9BURK|nr:hypothetical protein K788_0005228 [Paraburkholderia caribensis MBA4]
MVANDSRRMLTNIFLHGPARLRDASAPIVAVSRRSVEHLHAPAFHSLCHRPLSGDSAIDNKIAASTCAIESVSL